MAGSKKLEEKYQKVLKECQRRAENRSCFDCDGRGNQYVVLNFNTFVCTTCSGIHREFSHKIKSVGMSTFTIDEIKAIDKGGNETARRTWMAKFSSSEGSLHPEGDAEKIRNHLKAKCVTPPLFCPRHIHRTRGACDQQRSLTLQRGRGGRQLRVCLPATHTRVRAHEARAAPKQREEQQ
jgi:hypothetical protein